MLPLAGVRVLAFEHFGAGPFATLYLADLGAEVIKVEAPGQGDQSRRVGPYLLGEDSSLFFETFSRNKRSLTLDIKAADGRAVLHKLVATADGILDNLRGDQPARLGLTYADLRAHNPRLVCAHISAYGRTGARAGWPGYDYLMQAEAGFMTLTGEPGQPPAKFGLSMVDYVTGMTAAVALLSGIVAARARGEGCDVDASLFDTALHQLSYPATWYLNEGLVTGQIARSSHPSLVPSQLFTTADGWIMAMAMTQRFWELLVGTLGRRDLVDDPSFADFAGRLRNRERLTEILDAAFRMRTTADWVAALAGQVPVAPVYDLAAALDSGFVSERRMIEEHAHRLRERLRLVANPILIDGERLPGKPAPALGADTDAILGDLGLSPEAIATLRRRGAI
ncbi:MAG: CoA transferase [Alphaproteobacteria bacterium]|nr:CoA transferase [Alphaproteobacteria bacterium]